jgi:hypothetical protein
VGMLTKMSLIGTILIRRSSGTQAVGHKVGAYVGLLVAARDILWSQAAVVAQVMTIHATPFLSSCFIVKKIRSFPCVCVALLATPVLLCSHEKAQICSP